MKIEGEGDRVEETLGVKKKEAEADKVSIGEKVGLMVGESEAESQWLTETLRVCERLPVVELVKEGDRVPETVKEMKELALMLGVTLLLKDSEAVEHALEVSLLVPERDTLPLTETVLQEVVEGEDVNESDGVADKDALMLGDTLLLKNGETVEHALEVSLLVPETDTLPLTETVLQAVTEGEGVNESDGVADKEALMLGDTLLLKDREAVEHALEVSLLVPERDTLPLTETVLQEVTEKEGDNELLEDTECEGDPLTLSLKDAVIQLEDVCDSVEDTLGELEEDPDELRETESV